MSLNYVAGDYTYAPAGAERKVIRQVIVHFHKAKDEFWSAEIQWLKTQYTGIGSPPYSPRPCPEELEAADVESSRPPLSLPVSVSAHLVYIVA
jgi:hypothetical protein